MDERDKCPVTELHLNSHTHSRNPKIRRMLVLFLQSTIMHVKSHVGRSPLSIPPEIDLSFERAKILKGGAVSLPIGRLFLPGVLTASCKAHLAKQPTRFPIGQHKGLLTAKTPLSP